MKKGLFKLIFKIKKAQFARFVGGQYTSIRLKMENIDHLVVRLHQKILKIWLLFNGLYIEQKHFAGEELHPDRPDQRWGSFLFSFGSTLLSPFLVPFALVSPILYFIVFMIVLCRRCAG